MSWVAAIPLVTRLIDRIFPDQEARDKAKVALLEMEQTGELDALAKRAGIVTAEIEGESWLQRSWRPMVMLWFAGLVGAHWFGMTPPNLSEDAINGLFLLVQIGIGGYVVGRSGEKIAKEWKKET